MTANQKNELIAEIVHSLTEAEKITYNTLYFNGLSNDEIAHYFGFRNEKEYDNTKNLKKS